MLGIGFGEMVIIAVILLIAVGPKELPALLKTVGKGIREVRKASNELRKSTGIDELLRDDDLRNPFKPEPPKYQLRTSDRERENPREGVDAAHALAQAETAARVAQEGLSGAPINVEQERP
jgi:sec-independent protein translocase protein TatB